MLYEMGNCSSAASFYCRAKELACAASARTSALSTPAAVLLLPLQALQSKSKMGLTAQFDALALDKAPRFGWAYDLTY